MNKNVSAETMINQLISFLEKYYLLCPRSALTAMARYQDIWRQSQLTRRRSIYNNTLPRIYIRVCRYEYPILFNLTNSAPGLGVLVTAPTHVAGPPRASRLDGRKRRGTSDANVHVVYMTRMS